MFLHTSLGTADTVSDLTNVQNPTREHKRSCKRSTRKSCIDATDLPTNVVTFSSHPPDKVRAPTRFTHVLLALRSPARSAALAQTQLMQQLARRGGKNRSLAADAFRNPSEYWGAKSESGLMKFFRFRQMGPDSIIFADCSIVDILFRYIFILYRVKL